MMSVKRMQTLVVLSMTLSVTLVVANLLAMKLWSFGGIAVDAGILMFPLTYVAGDLTVEFFGDKIADFVAFVAAGFGVVTLMMIYLAACLPNYPGVDNSGFEAVSGMAGQIFLASIVSFLLGQLVNNRLFEKIRHAQNKIIADKQVEIFEVQLLDIHGVMPELPSPAKIATESFPKAFAKRAILSSNVAHAVDAIVFEVIAFCGKLPLIDFVKQIVFAYIVGLFLEICIFPLTYFLARKGNPTP